MEEKKKSFIIKARRDCAGDKLQPNKRLYAKKNKTKKKVEKAKHSFEAQPVGSSRSAPLLSSATALLWFSGV